MTSVFNIQIVKSLNKCNLEGYASLSLTVTQDNATNCMKHAITDDNLKH